MVMTMVKKGDYGRRISAGEFKAKCLRVMEQVAATGEPVVVTKRGVPIAELGPVRGAPARLFGSLHGRIEIHGDIIAPVDGVTWEAAR